MISKGWSLNWEDWQGLEELFREDNGWIPWRKVTLSPHNSIMVPNTSGVYGICAAPPFAVRPRESNYNGQTMFHGNCSGTLGSVNLRG